jgi:hypothetical protein
VRSTLFGRVTAYVGILAGAAGIAAVIIFDHVSASHTVLALAIAPYFATIVFLFIWVVLTGRRFYELSPRRTVAEP